MVGYAEQDELVTYSVTVRTWFPVLRHVALNSVCCILTEDVVVIQEYGFENLLRWCLFALTAPKTALQLFCRRLVLWEMLLVVIIPYGHGQMERPERNVFGLWLNVS